MYRFNMGTVAETVGKKRVREGGGGGGGGIVVSLSQLLPYIPSTER